MKKHTLTAFLFTISASAALLAQDAAPTVWKEDFKNGKNYVVQRVDNDKQKAAKFRKEYKDSNLILYYKFGPKCSPTVQGTFVYGIAKPIDLKGGTVLEICYRTPIAGIGNIMTWTYTDAAGKQFGDWTRLPESEGWKTLRFEMDKGGFGGKKKAKPAPVKLTALDIYSSPKHDDVERSIEIDYIAVLAPAKK